MMDTSGLAAPEPRHPYMRAYRTLRFELAAGARLPGDRIVVGEVASALGISPTPVREALAHMSGERLVDDRRSYGYFVPLPSWFDLLELYDLNALLLTAAIREAGGPPRSRARPPEIDLVLPVPGDDPLGNLYHSVLALSSSARLATVGRIHVDMLAAARRTEAALFGQDGQHAARLRRLIEEGEWKQALALLRGQFRLCRLRAEPVAFAMAAASRARNSRNIV